MQVGTSDPGARSVGSVPVPVDDIAEMSIERVDRGNRWEGW